MGRGSFQPAPPGAAARTLSATIARSSSRSASGIVSGGATYTTSPSGLKYAPLRLASANTRQPASPIAPAVAPAAAPAGAVPADSWWSSVTGMRYGKEILLGAGLLLAAGILIARMLGVDVPLGTLIPVAAILGGAAIAWM